MTPHLGRDVMTNHTSRLGHMINNNTLLVLGTTIKTGEDRLNVVSCMFFQVEEEGEEELGGFHSTLERPVNNVSQNGWQDLGEISVD